MLRFMRCLWYDVDVERKGIELASRREPLPALVGMSIKCIDAPPR